MKLFVVGQVRGGVFPDLVWDLQGVFSSEEKALSACHGTAFCIIPVDLDVEAPIEKVVAPGCYYPKA